MAEMAARLSVLTPVDLGEPVVEILRDQRETLAQIGDVDLDRRRLPAREVAVPHALGLADEVVELTEPVGQQGEERGEVRRERLDRLADAGQGDIVAEAKALHWAVDRPNVMIKVSSAPGSCGTVTGTETDVTPAAKMI